MTSLFNSIVTRYPLGPRQRSTHLIQLTGAAQLLVLVGNESGVLGHEGLARPPKIKLGRVVAEELAVDARPPRRR